MRLNELLEDINQVPKFYSEIENEDWRVEGDCAIVALSLTCKVSYEIARDTLKKNNSLVNDGGASVVEIRKSLNDLGYDCRKVDITYYHNMLTDKINKDGLTKQDIMNSPEIFDDIKCQLWFIHAGYSGSHVFAVIDGKIEDYGTYKDEDGKYLEQNWVIEILDVYKMGDKPNITDNVLWNKNPRNIINNYDEFMPQFIKYYNSRLKDLYKIDEEKACIIIELHYDALQSHGKDEIQIPPHEVSTMFWSADFDVKRDENWNLSIIKTNYQKFNNYNEARNHIVDIYNKYARAHDNIDNDDAHRYMLLTVHEAGSRYDGIPGNIFNIHTDDGIDTSLIITNDDGTINAMIRRPNENGEKEMYHALK